jgi:phage terminase large subunit GpA-like protein
MPNARNAMAGCRICQSRQTVVVFEFILRRVAARSRFTVPCPACPAGARPAQGQCNCKRRRVAIAAVKSSTLRCVQCQLRIRPDYKVARMHPHESHAAIVAKQTWT